VRRRDERKQAFLACGSDRLHVAVEQRLERLFAFPLRMLRRQCPDAIHRECQLEVHRLLAPERAVIVEGGDALGNRHELCAALRRHPRGEIGDGFLRRPVIPRRQRIRLR
jgi:hypothetical protein